MKRWLLVIVMVICPTKTWAEIPPQIPVTAQFMSEASSESEVPGIFFSCDLYQDVLTTTTVFFKVCRVRGAGKSVVQITAYEKHFEEVVMWAAEGFEEE